MVVPVERLLVLEAADSTLSPDDPPTAAVYPNRVLTVVPPFLHRLVSAMEDDHDVEENTEAEFDALALSLVSSYVGSTWTTSSYVSNSKEVSGGWDPTSGYSYSLVSGGEVLDDPRSAVDDDCVCTYLLHLSPQI